MGYAPQQQELERELDALELRPVPRLHLRHAAQCATRAPSAWNTQPWLLRLGERSLEVWADHSRALPVGDPYGRELTIACGAALLHAQIALQRLGWRVEVDLCPEFRTPDCLARLTLIERRAPDVETRRLYAAIHTRRSHHGSFPDQAPCEHVAREWELCVLREGAWVSTMGPDLRGPLAQLVEESFMLQAQDAALRSERLQWITHGQQAEVEGLSRRALGYSCAPAALLPWLWKSNWGMRRRAQREAQWIREAPCVLLISTLHEEPSAWLQAGAALARVLLTAGAAGVSAAFHSSVTEHPRVRHSLRQLAGNLAFPQVLLRLGYADPTHSSGRRDWTQVCFEETPRGAP